MHNELEQHLRSLGTDLVGFADVDDLPSEVRHQLPSAVSLAVALNKDIIAEIVAGPTLAYEGEYCRANELLDFIASAGAEFLRSRGYRSVAMKSTFEQLDKQSLATPLPHKTVATRAGLGWIGKSALLVTEAFGSAVRLTSILTDAPLPVGTPVESSRCDQCNLCVSACPGRAATGQKWHVGMERQEYYDACACFRTIKEGMPARGLKHTVCGVCIAVCPWTQRYLNK